MMRELLITLHPPDFLIAQYGQEQVRVPLKEIENDFIFGLLPRLDEYVSQERERYMVFLGQKLFEMLFPPGVLEIYLRAMADQRRTSHAALRIRIVSSECRFLTLPWEFLYDSRQAVFPATVPETPIVRGCDTPQPGSALEPIDGLRLLIAGAAPSDERELNYLAELDSIERLAKEAGVLVERLEKTTSRQLAEALERFKPHIFHFAGHGFVHADGAGIKLEDRRGNTHLILGDRLLELLAPASPRLVVLNACHTGQMLQSNDQHVLPKILLRGGIPAVVAMQHRVPDAAALVFGQSLFSELWKGLSLERAFQAGRHALLVSGGLLERHFSTPTLYLATEQGGFAKPSEELAVEPDPALTARSPFLYLSSFRPEDASLFFGRSKAIEALVSRVATHRILVVHGRSGVGKSSLLQAGLVQSSAARLYHSVAIRFVGDPVQALEEAVDRALSAAPALASHQLSPRGEGGFTELLTNTSSPARLPQVALQLRQLQAQTGRTILLILDQFEEFFVLLDSAQRKDFLQVLHALYMDSELRLRIVLVIREEFLGELDRLRDIFPTILANSYFLAALSADEAREALVGPLDSLGVRYEGELINAVLRDLLQNGVEPSSLQIVGHHLYRHCHENLHTPLTLQAYEQLGRAGGILAEYLGGFLGAFSDAEQSLLLKILNQFITDQETRQPCTAQHISTHLGLPLTVVQQQLWHLGSAHLIRRLDGGELGEHNENAQWELSHEVLIAAIRQTEPLNLNREVNRIRRRLRFQLVVGNLALVLVLLIFYFLSRHNLNLRIEAPTEGQWTLSLFPGQRGCNAREHSPVPMHEFQGHSVSLSLLPVGHYEATLRRGDEPPVKFAVEVSPFGMDEVVLEPVPQAVLSNLPPNFGLDLVYVPGGKGDVGDDAMYRVDMGLPAQPLTFAPFYMSRYEITRAQYQTYLKETGQAWQYPDPCLNLAQTAVPTVAGPSNGAPSIPETARGPSAVKGRMATTAKPNDAAKAEEASSPPFWYTLTRAECNLTAEQQQQLPVGAIRYLEAIAFTRWLSTKVPGYRFDLPSEEQWERAARGGDGRYFAWGNCRASGSQANLNDRNEPRDDYESRSPVGRFRAGRSPYGIDDMTGNVHELTATCRTRHSMLPGETGVAPCDVAIFRGGSYLTARVEAFTTLPGRVEVTQTGLPLGFRVVMSRKTDYPETPSTAVSEAQLEPVLALWTQEMQAKTKGVTPPSQAQADPKAGK